MAKNSSKIKDDEDISGLSDTDSPPTNEPDPDADPNVGNPQDQKRGVEDNPESEVNSNQEFSDFLNQENQDESQEQTSEPNQDQSNLDTELEAQPSSQSLNPQLSKYQNFLEEYKKLQDQRRKSDLVNGLLAAGGKIGQSMAGKYSGNFNPDQTGNKMLEAIANRPVQDFEQRQIVQGRGMQLEAETAAADPNSPQSKLVRDYIQKRLGISLADNVSAADAQMLLKTVGRPVQETMRFVNLTNTNPNSADYGKTIMGKLSKTGAMYDSKGNPLSDNYVIQNAEQFMKDANGNVIGLNKNVPNMAPRIVQASAYKPVEQMSPEEVTNFRPDINQRKALAEEQKRMDTMTKAAREGVESANKLEQALNSNNVYQGATLKTTLPKLMGFNGRMSPLEQQMWTGSQAWNDRAAQYMQTAEEGTLTDKNKQEALALLEDYKQNVTGDLENISQGSQQHLQQTFAIPKQFSAKAIQLPALTKKQGSDNMVQVTSAKTGKTFMLSKDKIQEALDKKLIKPLSQ